MPPPHPWVRRLARGRRAAGLIGPVLGSNLGRLPTPWKLTLAVTWVCNHRCAHCRIWERRPRGELSTAEIERLFVRNPGVRWLDLTGGEPTARADLPEIVEAASRALRGLLLLHFPTNGSRPDRAVAAARAAVTSGPARVLLTVSLDGPPAVHARVRGIPGAWDAAIETFARLRAEPGVDVVLGMTLTPDNVREVEATYQTARARLGALERSELHFNVAQTSAHFYGNAGMETAPRAAVEAALARWPSRGVGPQALLERAYRALVPRYLASGASPVPCQALSASAFVDPFGAVYPCISEDRVVGQLRDVDFDLAAIWRSTEDAADDMRAGRCAGCWTPCEAYQSLLGSLPRAAGALL